jgi:hypothetical protein
MKLVCLSRFSISVFIALVASSFSSYYLFFPQWHDWDIEAFLYLGSRLANGSLLYFSEFETKLPFVQYIFWLPAKLGGIGAWRILTFSTALFLGGVGSYFLAQQFLAGQEKKADFISCTNLTSFFILLLYTLPGSSSSHIEIVSASAIYCSIALIFSRSNENWKRLIFALISGALMAVSCLIRPNYFYTIPLSIILYLQVNTSVGAKFAIRNVSVFLIGLLIIIALSFMPYILVPGGSRVLQQGIVAIGKYPHGILVGELFIKQLHDHWTVCFYIFIYLGSMIAVSYNFLGLKSRSIPRIYIISVVFCVASIAVVNITFIRTHYSSHYSIMLVPYAVLLALSLERLFVHHNTSLIQIFIQYVLVILILIAPLKHVGLMVEDLLLHSEKISLNINDRGDIDPNFVNFLRELKLRSNSFLVDGDSLHHRILEETRVGDGHPAILDHILAGNYIQPVSKNFLLSYEVSQKPCLAITNSGKDWIIVNRVKREENSQVLKCLMNPDSGYQEIVADKSKTHIHIDKELVKRYRFFLKEKSILW